MKSVVWDEQRRYPPPAFHAAPLRAVPYRRSRALSTAHPHARIGRIFGAAAVFEAFTWAGLLVGMFLEHVTHTTEMGVWLFGRLHGAAFMIYVVVTLVAWRKLRWPLWVTAVTLAASIPPLTTLVAEWWLARTGRLAASDKRFAVPTAQGVPDRV
jgi:integral membrane protein